MRVRLLFYCVLSLFMLKFTTALQSKFRLPRWSTALHERRKKKISTTSATDIVGNLPVRVRFAPSPTGSLHVGGARTALFNWLFARRHGGKFIVRVEDTDEARSSKSSEESILRDLEWLGLDVDEGPGLLGGDVGPYRQSERKKIYAEFADRLIESGHAYRCFCSAEELQLKKDALVALRKPTTYDGEWRDRSPADIEEQLKAGTPYTVRFKVPNKNYFINDIVRGRVVWNPYAALGDFIIMRSTGVPVYNFCVAIDDYLMKITHVIRAEEHLSNTIKQILIFEAIGCKHPQYAHCSLILAPDKTKLSKRHGAAALSDFAGKGYFPSSMRNYLAMLGWNPGTTKEIYTNTSELVEEFDVSRIVKSGAVFDITRLNWINTKHISLLPDDEYTSLCGSSLRNSSLFPLRHGNVTECLDADVAALEKEFIELACSLGKGNIKFIDDIVSLTKTMLCYPFSEAQLDKKGTEALKKDYFVPVAKSLLSDFKDGTLPVPTIGAEYPDKFSHYLLGTCKKLGLGKKDVFISSRLSLTGSPSGADIGCQLRLLEIALTLMKIQPQQVLDGLKTDVVSLDQRMASLEAYIEAIA